jgi:hypothetical protein
VKMGSLQHAKLFISVVVQFLHLLFFTKSHLTIFDQGSRQRPQPAGIAAGPRPKERRL